MRPCGGGRRGAPESRIHLTRPDALGGFHGVGYDRVAVAGTARGARRLRPHRPMPVPREPYSYRRDPDVAAFPDDRPVIVYDGHCALCSGWARFVIRHDPEARYRLLPAQSSLGQALYRHYGLDPRNFETNLLLRDGRPFLKLDGSIRMAEGLGAPWSSAAVLRMLPARWGEALYDLVARNRLRWFGRLDVCHRPDAADAFRFLA